MNWLLLGAPIVGALAGVLALASCHPDPKIAAARSSALTATTQAQINTTAPQIAQQSATKTLHIEVTTKEAVHDIQTAVGADTPVPPDVAARWARDVDGLRKQALAAHAGSARGASPSGVPIAVPAT